MIDDTTQGTAPATIPATSTAAPPATHASTLQSIFSDVEKVVVVASSPAVLALLPAKYQAYAQALALVEAIFSGATTAAAQ